MPPPRVQIGEDSALLGDLGVQEGVNLLRRLRLAGRALCLGGPKCPPVRWLVGLG